MKSSSRAYSFVLVGLLLFSAGCPVSWDRPKRGPGAACDGIADCNAGRTCGELLACVDGLCEATPSLHRVCDAGQGDGGDVTDGGAEDASSDAD